MPLVLSLTTFVRMSLACQIIPSIVVLAGGAVMVLVLVWWTGIFVDVSRLNCVVGWQHWIFTKTKNLLLGTPTPQFSGSKYPLERDTAYITTRNKILDQDGAAGK
jgi:hypothetical protein